MNGISVSVAKMGIKITTTTGDTMEGMKACPGSPLGYVAEGKVTPVVGKQYDPETFPLTAAVKEAGISEADWDAICESLRKGKGITGIGGGFSKAIVKANEEFFDKCGLEATCVPIIRTQDHPTTCVDSRWPWLLMPPATPARSSDCILLRKAPASNPACG